jgi:hypothetical protein
MTRRQALQHFPDTSQVSLHKIINQLTFFIVVPAESREVTVALNFVSERTVLLCLQRYRIKLWWKLKVTRVVKKFSHDTS